MSVRPGSVTTVLFPTTGLGGAAGQNIPLRNQYAVIPGVLITFITTGTVNNRLLIIRLLDSLSNVLMQTSHSTVIAASLTVRIALMAGASGTIAAGASQQLAPWPAEMAAPPNASLQIFDNSNIDPLDTISVAVTLVQ